MEADRRVLRLILLGVLLVKLSLLAVLGPTLFPDSALYIDLGRDILAGPAWLHDGQWSTGWSPARLSRPYGYPLLIAAATWGAGSGFRTVLAVVQAGVSVLVLGWFAQMARRWIADRRLWVAVVVLCGLSQFLLFDLAILTDSFYASLFIVVMLAVAAQIDGFLPNGKGLAVVLGSLWALSLTFRDVGLYHTVLPLAGLCWVAWRRRRLSAWLRPVLFLAPVILLVTGVTAWNLHRTGHSVFSITGGVNWLWPSINMADRNLAHPFDCSDPICLAAQQQGIHKGMDGALTLASQVAEREGLDAQALGRVTLRHFLGVVVRHPLAYTASVLGNLQFSKLADLVFNPLASLNELCQLHDGIGHRLIPGARELLKSIRQGEWLALPVLLGSVLLNLVAMLCLAWTTLYAPWRGWRERHQHGAAILFLWLSCAVFIGSYSLIHMEMRHALPTVPLLLIVFGWAAGRCTGRFHERR